VGARQREIEIVPGVVGPETVTWNGRAVFTTARLEAEYEFRFDGDLWRYVCDKLTVHANHGVPITAAALREVKVAEIMLAVLMASGEPPGRIRDLPNPDGREPWGRQLPDGLAEEGPTDRALRWVAHIYRFAFAVGGPPTGWVEEAFGLTRPTAGRWISAARQRGFLGPAEVGKAGG
jgi:hypothetical protein